MFIVHRIVHRIVHCIVHCIVQRRLQQQLAHRRGGLRLLRRECVGLVLVDAAEPLGCRPQLLRRADLLVGSEMVRSGVLRAR